MVQFSSAVTFNSIPFPAQATKLPVTVGGAGLGWHGAVAGVTD